ncbi:MAG: hypothetical protein OIN88_00395 [Candidatus Methanoperedens sp.]|nr:hypothetical protein [Candidatus Methanoperedens sp.]
MRQIATAGEKHHDLTCSDPDVSAKAAGHSRKMKARCYRSAGAVCEAAACVC